MTGAIATAGAGWAPVLVTAVLCEPVIGLDAHPAHLDGPLSWAAYKEGAAGRQASRPPGRDEPAPDFPLPLAVWTSPAPAGADRAALDGDGMAWGWACSRALYSPAGRTTVQVRKRPETGAAARYAREGSWDIGSGPLKARDVPFGAVLVREVRWHALGDPEALRRLLAAVYSLGRLRGHGHGAVQSWRVEEHEDRDAWRDRVFPLEGGRPGAVRAPYWHPTRMMPCTP